MLNEIRFLSALTILPCVSLSYNIEGLEMSIFLLLCGFIPGQLYIYSSPGLWTIVRVVGLAYVFIQNRVKSNLYNFSNVLFCSYNKLHGSR